MSDFNNLREKTLSSMIWKFMERIAAQLVSLIVSIIIARLLSPSDYGIVSIVTIFFVFSDIIISGGLNTALIQKKEPDDKDYSTVLIITIVMSIIVYAIMFFCAPWISKIYNQPLLIPTIRIMGLVMPVNGIKSIVCAYVSSTLQFRKFFYSTLGGTIASGIVGIFLALHGAGVWALIVQQMTNTFVDTFLLFIITKFKFKICFSIKRAKGLFGYGWKILVSSLINTAYSQIRPIVIGVKFSAADLSFYSKGESFPQLINSTTTDTLSAVLFPVLAKFQDDKKALLKYTRLFIQLASFVAFPLMLGMYAVADKMIIVLLSEKWIGATIYIRVFAIANMFNMINSGNCETIKAMGKSDVFLKMEIIKKTSYFVIIAVFIFFSNDPIYLAYSAYLCTVIAIIVNTIPNRKFLGYSYIDQVLDVLQNLVTSVLMCVIVMLIGHLVRNVIICLLVQIVIGAIFYLTINYFLKNRNLFYIKDIIKQQISKNI